MFNTNAFSEDWNEYKRTHFIVYYNEAPLDFVKTVEKAADEYYRSIARNMGYTRYKGWTYDERTRIYIYDSQAHYVKSAKTYSWSHGVASPRDRVIRTFPAAHGFFDSTLPHEIGHIIFREFIGFKAEVPLWFEEGVAMYQEKAKRWGSHDTVRLAIKNGDFIPIPELSVMRLTSKTPRETVGLFYKEAASIVYYMITELGEVRFARFARELKEGKSFESAMAKIYVRFRDYEALNKAWRRYLEK
ncbi:MAG: hypothetical protein ACI8Q2_000447 [Candidatus Omnitrophota bacterium]|jgi:hypothetical protein